MFKKIKDLVLAPFRKAREITDTHPGGTAIRKYAEAVRMVDYQGELTLIIPSADHSVGTPRVDNLNTPDDKRNYCRGFNDGLRYLSNIRRSDINPALKLHRTALKQQRKVARAQAQQEAEVGKRQAELRKETMNSGIPLTPPGETGPGLATSAA